MGHTYSEGDTVTFSFPRGISQAAVEKENHAEATVSFNGSPSWRFDCVPVLLPSLPINRANFPFPSFLQRALTFSMPPTPPKP